MQFDSTQHIRNEVIALLKDKHGFDSFETREFLGMMFCQAVVADIRRKQIAPAEDYLQSYLDMIRANVRADPITP